MSSIPTPIQVSRDEVAAAMRQLETQEGRPPGGASLSTGMAALAEVLALIDYNRQATAVVTPDSAAYEVLIELTTARHGESPRP